MVSNANHGGIRGASHRFPRVNMRHRHRPDGTYGWTRPGTRYAGLTNSFIQLSCVY